ncbi:signal peptidase I [Enterococcus termitis]|uniref:Signal peptidase I n=1 Tax=Enterococcus termitis TaxID=332950 RepID=A0A1E5G8W9_9ENTE|nr:signal peptidase I [Enterococcus termitis]OEG09163.1 signal peptidase I [Enterococcus termitis]OJG98620.1 signal peptidase I [Enterococcus termitis]
MEDRQRKKKKTQTQETRIKSSKQATKKKRPRNQKPNMNNKAQKTSFEGKKREHKGSHKERKPIPTKKRNPVYTYIFNLFFYSFISFMVIGSILFATSKSSDRSLLGYRFFGVLTDSMVARDPKTQKGGFRSGDIIIVKNIAGDKAEVGDIITFKPSVNSSAYLTHRVKKKMDHLGETKGTYYITQGDANKAEDVPVSEKQVIGKKVFAIPKIGSILNFVSDNLIVSIVFLVSVFGFITIIRYYILNK